MKKIRNFIILIILAAAGYFGYKYYPQFISTSFDGSLWELVPDESLIVFESDNIPEEWESFKENKVGSKWVNTVPFKELIRKIKAFGDDFRARESSLNAFFGEKKILVSVLGSKHEWATGALIPVTSEDKSLIGKVLTSKDIVKLSSYDYKGYTFTRYKMTKPAGFTFIQVFTEKYLIVCDNEKFAKLSIDNTEKEAQHLVAEKMKESFQNKSFPDRLHLYFNANLLFEELDLLDAFVNIKKLFPLYDYAHLSMNPSDGEIHLNGLAHPMDSVFSMIESFEMQDAQEFDVSSIIPNTASIVTFVGVDKFRRFTDNMDKFYWDQGVEVTRDPIYLQDIEKWIGKEMAHAVISNTYGVRDELLFLQYRNETVADEFLKSYVIKSDTFQQGIPMKSIKSIPVIAELGLPDTMEVEKVNGYLVFGKDSIAIKNLFDSIENEEVWGKTNELNVLLDENLPDANLALVLNLEAGIKNRFDEWGIQKSQAISELINPLSFLIFQISVSGDLYYQDIVAATTGVKENYIAEALSEDTDKLVSSELDSKIITKPFLVRNHTNNAFEIVVQDEKNLLHLIANNGKVIWSKDIGEPIISDVEQIDYYKNNKLQLLFATASKVVCLDRNGNPVEGFPHTLPDEESTIRYLSIVDYDGSKRYRFVITDDKKQVWFLNKEGKALPGWNPKIMDSQVSFPVAHIRVRGRDHIAVQQKDGNLFVFDRSGELKTGFPVKLSDEPTQFHVHVDANNKFTRFYTINAGGQFNSVNLNATNEEKEVLHGAENSYYKFSVDPVDEELAIFKINENGIEVFSKNLDILFQKPVKNSGEIIPQYYSFNKKRIYALTDKGNKVLTLYNDSGRNLISRHRESSHEIALLYHGMDLYEIFKTHDNLLEIIKIQQ